MLSNRVIGILFVMILGSLTVAIAHNSRVDRRAKDIGGTRFTTLEWKFPFVPSL